MRPRKTGSEFCWLFASLSVSRNDCVGRLYTRGDSPYTVGLASELIESANVLPALLGHTDDILEILDDRPTEVEGEIGAVVVASGGPGFVAGVFGGLFRELDSDRVEIEEGA